MHLSRFLRNLFALTGLLWALVSFTSIDSWWAYRLARPWGSGDGDVLVVLGGDSMGDVLGASSYLRAVYTVRAMRQHQYRRVIITGADGVAEHMRDYVSAHVHGDSIELETQAHSTRENAVNVKTMLAGETGTVILLTSDYHVYRSLQVFRKAGLTAQASPAPDAIKRSSFWEYRGVVFTELCTESLNIIWYRFQGWI